MTIATTARRPALVRMLTSERIKLTSTNTWWIVGLAITACTGAALAYNLFLAAADLSGALSATSSAQDAADAVTSGQYGGALFVMVLAILMITNEFHHQTATSTFLASPDRATVIAGKFVMALLLGVGVWATTTVIDFGSTLFFFRAHGAGSLVTSASTVRAIGVSLIIYLLWAAFGIGLGALIRGQIGATITAIIVYTIGSYPVEAVAYLFYLAVWHTKKVYEVLVLIPGFAGQVASSPHRTSFEGVSFMWWEGVIVMIAYAILATVIGTATLRKRDIS